MKKNKSKIKLKIGDNVKIISGKYKGTVGKISKIFTNKNTITIENLNLKTKHVKSQKNEEKGHIKQIEGHIHYSNIKLIN